MAKNINSVKHIRDVERQAKALQLRKGGVGYERIAQLCGYAGAGSAHRAVTTALRRLTDEPAADVLKLELARLDSMLVGLWERAIHGETKAVEKVLAIMDRRARYLGLDAPTKIDIEPAVREQAADLGLDPDAAVAEVGRLLAEARRAGA